MILKNNYLTVKDLKEIYQFGSNKNKILPLDIEIMVDRIFDKDFETLNNEEKETLTPKPPYEHLDSEIYMAKGVIYLRNLKKIILTHHNEKHLNYALKLSEEDYNTTLESLSSYHEPDTIKEFLKYNRTFGKLLLLIQEENINDETTIWIERIEDVYFEKHNWSTLKYEKLNAISEENNTQGITTTQEYALIDIHTMVYDKENNRIIFWIHY